MGFTVPVDQLAARATARLHRGARERIHFLFSTIVMRTPVASGFARANWNVSAGAPSYSVTPTTNLARAIGEVDKVLDLPIGSDVFLTNAVPYIRLLEYGGYPVSPKKPTGKSVGGFSSQAPAGMVRISVAEFGGVIEG